MPAIVRDDRSACAVRNDVDVEHLVAVVELKLNVVVRKVNRLEPALYAPFGKRPQPGSVPAHDVHTATGAMEVDVALRVPGPRRAERHADRVRD